MKACWSFITTVDHVSYRDHYGGWSCSVLEVWPLLWTMNWRKTVGDGMLSSASQREHLDGKSPIMTHHDVRSKLRGCKKIHSWDSPHQPPCISDWKLILSHFSGGVTIPVTRVSRPPPASTHRSDGTPPIYGGSPSARCAETNFPAGINLGQWRLPPSHQQFTMVT